jgi:hypothetical protein
MLSGLFPKDYAKLSCRFSQGVSQIYFIDIAIIKIISKNFESSVLFHTFVS